MSTTKTPAYLISNSGNVVVHMNGKVMTASVSHKNYNQIVKAIQAKQWAKLPDLFNVGTSIEKYTRRVLRVKNGQVFYGKEVVHNAVVDRMLKFMNDGFDFKPLFNFLKRLLKNPSENSKEQLYKFMEANELPVTWDGYVLAYKKVTPVHTDFHTGKYDNSVGKTVAMPREEVVDDAAVACSSGLHVGSLHYARDEFHSDEGVIVLVKVDPADVVSVPTDYNHAKCRVCKYFVLSDYHVYDGQDSTPKSAASEVTQTGANDISDNNNDYCLSCGESLDACDCDM